MKPLLVLLALLAAPGPALAEDPCHWLETAKAETVLGAPVTLTPGLDRTDGDTVLQLCTATTGTGTSLALLYRIMDPGNRSPADLVAAYRAELSAAMVPPPSFEPLPLGDAALWDPGTHQLTVWSHAGRVMMIFTLFGPKARDHCAALARTILAAGG